jgi:large subunit ribosomal protein L4
MKINTYTHKGTKKGTTSLPKDWSEKENLELLAQAIRVYENKIHKGISKTKRRGEVVASTRKIYRQKGTGRARHGALSAPIFVGGGKAHGPDGLKRSLRLPKKMKKKALRIALKMKIDEGNTFVVEGINELKKTKDAAKLIILVSKKEKKLNLTSGVTVALSEKNKKKERVFRNIDNVSVVEFKNLNAHSVFFGGNIIIDSEVFKKTTTKGSKKK